jgi:hypothetical protein
MLSQGYMGDLIYANSVGNHSLVHKVVVPYALLTEFVPTIVFMLCQESFCTEFYGRERLRREEQEALRRQREEEDIRRLEGRGGLNDNDAIFNQFIQYNVPPEEMERMERERLEAHRLRRQQEAEA